jgi:hypothetical protein
VAFTLTRILAPAAEPGYRPLRYDLSALAASTATHPRIMTNADLILAIGIAREQTGHTHWHHQPTAENSTTGEGEDANDQANWWRCFQCGGKPLVRPSADVVAPWQRW